MKNKNIYNEEFINLEKYKHVDVDNYEYYSARELQKVFGYSEWRGFACTISKAMKISEKCGYDTESLFKEVYRKIKAGATYKYIKDYQLNKLACYLIILESDSRKTRISYFKTYLALHTLVEGW